MKIGIVSLYGWLKLWDNYGTLLQNYALQTRLGQLGHETFWIRTRPSPSVSTGSPSAAAKFAQSMRTLAGSAWRYASRGPTRATIDAFNRAHPRHFAQFFERHVPHTDREYTGEELMAGPPQADAYIVGSDQVWRDVSRMNFLEFVPAPTRRIAYGVSAPWSTLSPEWVARAGAAIEGFHAVSVRERDGLDVCARIGRSDAVHVVDPTLLLESDDYRRLVDAEGAGQTFERPLALGYFVNVRSLRDVPWSSIRQFAVNNAMELRVVPLQGSELIFPLSHTYTPSPAEWLDAFHKAECVVTNSYHGTLFAVLMHKPFLALLQGGFASAQNARFFSALEPLGLAGRIVSQDEAAQASARDMERWMFADIDWPSVDARREAWRGDSEAFLVNALR